MKKSLFKNTVREIAETKARFFSIMAIIGLGVGFLSGVRSSSPSMLEMGKNYFSDSNLSDYRLISPVGFDEKDIDTVSKLSDVTAVMPSYYYDVYADIEGSASPLRAKALPKAYSDNNILNKLDVTQGRLPANEKETVIDDSALKNLKVGETLNIKSTIGDKKTKDTLKYTEYKIVGKVRTAEHISYERDSTTIGDGKLKGFFYIKPECFKSEKYTQLFVKTKFSSAGITPFEDSYTNTIDGYKNTLKSTGIQCINSFISDKQSELDDKKAEYYSKKNDALQKLKNAEKKLVKSKKEFKKKIKDAELELAKAKSKYNKGISDYYSEKEKFNIEIKKAKDTIKQSREKLKSSWQKYQSSKEKFDKKISQAKAELRSAQNKYKKAYDKFYKKIKPKADRSIKQLRIQSQSLSESLKALKEGYKEKDIKKIYSAIDQINTVLVSLGQKEIPLSQNNMKADNNQFNVLVTNIEKIISGLNSNAEKAESELKKGEAALIGSKQKLVKANKTLKNKETEGKKKLAAAKSKLINGNSKINSAEKKLDQKEKEANSKFASALNKLNSAKEKISSATVKLEKNKKSGEKKIASAEIKLKKSRQKAVKKFANAEKKLDKAQKKINKYKGKKWYIFTRADFPGYSSFRENAERVDDVATVFPVFFLLVSILVCVTTMSRLVDEKRTEIGTLKALGYSNSDIMKKYMAYSLLSCFAGCLVGISVGVPVLPKVLYNAYRIMYNMPDIKIIPNYPYIFMGVAAAVISTLAVTLYTCGRSLKENSASLMRPKAPKPGTRILLEKIPAIWKKMSFTGKVTARNLFRYKARFLMTVFGVAGCTALILASFYLHDGISDIVDKQYFDICHYDALLVNKKDGSSNYYSEYKKELADDKNISDFLLYYNKTISVKNKKYKTDNSVYIFVPENMTSFKNLVTLQDRITGKQFNLSSNGVIVTEKLASSLHIKKGDMITIEINNKEKPVTVNAVCENYIYNYVYISPDVYSNTFKKQPLYNTTLLKINNSSSNTEDVAAKKYLKNKYVSAIVFNEKIIENFKKTITSLDTVVLVMIICAGLLAIVVLYNLTNINIAERVREISTLKVLGFYNQETSAYIYRENIVLTAFGIVFGMVMGVFLGYFIILTCEIDTLMFGRTLKVPSYFYAGILTAFFSLVVNLIMHFKIRKIDMIESLKSIE